MGTVESAVERDRRLQNRWKGKMHFELERLGRRSRWNTLRALQVLKWWNEGLSGFSASLG
jgi:hypothetical protein